MQKTFKRVFLPAILIILFVLQAAPFASAGSEAAVTVAQATDMPEPSIRQICVLLEAEAKANNVPAGFFARLIWKESRFDHLAVSPVGAQGIAQFMPATAKERGLVNPFDYSQAIPASAGFLADLRRQFGNWGLAAAAYNAGSGRVQAWLKNGGFLPLETEGYVYDITGIFADDFIGAAVNNMQPLEQDDDFLTACQKMPVMRSRMIAQAKINPHPWSIQIAGNFKRNVVVAQSKRLRTRYNKTIGNQEFYISRQRTAMGRRGIYAVRIGAESRKSADNTCVQLRSFGGACIVMRNR